MKKAMTMLELRPLLAPHATPCISLFQPTHRRPPGTEQDPVRFRNLLGKVEALLSEQYDSRKVASLLDPLVTLTQGNFWHRHLDGLAVFCSADTVQHYRIPFRFPELAVVADTFHVAPLVRFLQSNHYFFVLALSQQRVSFYQGTPYSLGQIDFPELPVSLIEELGVEQRESFLNFHASNTGRREATFHGHGTPPMENTKEELARFFRAIDNALWDHILREERVPLVLAGVEYYQPIYHAITRYPHIVPGGVDGSFDYTTEEELHAKVWPFVNELFRAREEALLAEYSRLSGQQRTLDKLQDITQAALESRIRSLFLAEGEHLWGVWDRETNTLTHHSSQQDIHDDDILDDLAEVVLQNGGEVFMFDRARMPNNVATAAVLRW